MHAERRATVKVAKMQEFICFYIRMLPPVAYGSRPPSRRGANHDPRFLRSRALSRGRRETSPCPTVHREPTLLYVAEAVRCYLAPIREGGNKGGSMRQQRREFAVFYI